MFSYNKLSWRNIWRNKRRTAITVFALSFSLVLMIITTGLMAGYASQMERDITKLTISDIQIHHPDYLGEQSIYQTIKDYPELIRSLEEKGYKASPRFYGYGLISNTRTEKSAGIKIEGVDIAKERNVTELHFSKNLFKGNYLTGETFIFIPKDVEKNENYIEEPDFFSEEEITEGSVEPITVGEVLLGKKLAKTLKAKLGDEMVILTMAADGSMGNEVFKVTGILKNLSEDIDRTMVIMDRSSYNRLFSLSTDEAHELAVKRIGNEPLAEAKNNVVSVIGEKGEVKTWRELLPTLSNLLSNMNVLTYVMVFLMYIASGMVIMNSILMMVLERIKEFGIMKALGMGGGQVFILVFFETFYLNLQIGRASCRERV